MEDEEPQTEDGEAAEVTTYVKASRGWRHHVRLFGAMALLLFICAFIGGALPERQDKLDFQGSAELADPTLKMDWKPVSAYVMDRNITQSMLASERLKHEAQQIEEARKAEEDKKPIPKIAAPLLPGRVALRPEDVQSTVAKKFVDHSEYAVPTEQPVAADGGTVAGVAKGPTQKEKFEEDMSTLEALQKALRSLNADKNTELEHYSEDQP